MVSAGGRSSGAVSSLTSPFNVNQTASQIRKGLAYGVNTKKRRIFLLLEGLYAPFPPALCSLPHMMYMHIFLPTPAPPHTHTYPTWRPPWSLLNQASACDSSAS